MRSLLVLLCGGLLLTPVAAGSAEPPAPTATVAVVAYRLEEIPERADALLRRLKTAGPSQVVESRIARIEQEAATLGRELDVQVEQATGALERGASLGDLEDLRLVLEADMAPVTRWKDELDAEARRVAETLDEIARAELAWSATRTEPETIAAGDAVTRPVEETLTALEQTGSRLRAWRTRVLGLNDRLIRRRAAIDAVVDQLRAATASEGASLFLPDSAPFWRRGFGTQILNELPRAPAAIRAYAAATGTFVVANPAQFVLQGVLAALLMLVISALARQQRFDAVDGSFQSARMFERPYAIALLLAFLATPWLHPLAPGRVRQMMGTLALIPTARLVLHLSTRANVGLFAAVFLLMLFDRIGLALAVLPALARMTFLLVLVTGLGIAIWLTRRTNDDGGNDWLRRIAKAAAWALGLALLVEIGGWATLANVLGRGVIAGVLLALFISVAVVTLEALLVYLWSSPWARRTRVLSANHPVLVRTTRRVLRAAGVALWLYLWLTAIGIRSTAADAIAAFLQSGIDVGELSLSVGGVLAFALALVVASVTARVVNGILEAEVYPRTQLPRGLPYALSTLVRYGIYVLGLLFALAAAGFQLGQLAVLLGGLGIGIGLGLQDLVKDFAAGLTLLLERRVQVGDAIQTADKEIAGRVLAIGMRSTVVRNWNGAEVVVPNASLLSGTVTNWTLSDRLVRVEVAVGVAYGSDPDRVIALLRDVAASVDNLVADPPPQALFTGFGDSALNFALRAWTDEGYDRFATTTSELALAVHRSLTAANISIPFPQRDLHLASVSPEIQAALRGGEKG